MRQPSASRAAWLLLLFLTFLNILSFIDRQLIVYLAPMLRRELGLSLAKIALLYGYVFLVFYTVMGMLLGNAADRINRPRLIAVGLTLWSALTAASGAAMRFAYLASARLFVGVGEATLTPSAVSMLGDVFTPKKRAFASGFYYAGVPLGSGASMMLAGWIAPRYGWRACFYVLGVIGLFMVPLVLMIKNPLRGQAEAIESGKAVPEGLAERPSLGEMYVELRRALIRTPTLALAILTGVLLNFSLSAAALLLTWLTTERGLNYRTAAYISGGIVTVAGTLSTTLGGYASDWFHRRWAGGRMWFLVVNVILFAPFTIGVYMLPVATPYRLFYISWFVSTLGAFTWYGPVYATVQDMVPARIRSTGVAFLLLALNLLGSGLGPFVAGVIGDSASLWRGLIICTCIGFTAAIPSFFAARRYRSDLERAQRAEGLLPNPTATEVLLASS